ncbi:AT-rich interactive domain-containing protein 1A-like isoform X2 [Littorina saxatilis]|uniref:AT-rich interactive domain-containing protein 1A-like isoform X2 n=1 Tax=Littorina saxatilis TaxID=31220 RepID=UPI0038B50FEF
MRVLLLILSVIVAIKASKERAPLQGLPKEEKDILFELVKRLENDDVHDKLGWKDTAQSSQCDVSPNKSSIIKKKESLNNGAQFITLYKGAESNEACSDLCCKNVSCDLAVFEDKDDHYCYLFRCDGKCKFGHHSSYISNNIAHRSQPPPSAAEGSERDLIDLGHDSDTDSKNDGQSFKPTSAAATTAVATAPSTYIRAHSVGLEGPYCERDLHCEDPEAICNFHKCRCRESFYRKSHICRQVCPPSNFECLELGTLGRGPQCVSDQQVCDGIMQCADGSDEFNCPDTGAPPLRTWQQQQQLPSHAEAAQQPQQSQPAQPSRQQQQPFSQTDYLESQFNEQRAHPMNGVGQANSPISPQGFQGQGQNVGQGDTQPYQAYNSQQQVEPKQEIENSGQSHGVNQQSAPQAPAPGSSSGLSGNSNGYMGNSAAHAPPKGPGSPPQQQGASYQQQKPAGSQQNYQNPEMQKSQPLPQPHHAFQKVPSQSETMQQQQDSQQSYSGPHPKEPDHKALPQQPYENLSPQQPEAGPDTQQGYQNSGSQRYHPAGSQPYHGQLPQQPAVDSRRPPQPHSSGQSIPQQNRPHNNRIYTEGGGTVNSKHVGSQGQHIAPVYEQNAQQQSLNQPRPNPQKVGPGAARPLHGKPADKSGSFAGARPQGPRTTERPVLNDGQKTYVVPGHSKGQNDPGTAYQPPVGKGMPEDPRHHSAYDVRVGEPSVPLRKTGSGQKSFLNPEELNDYDTQGSSHFLDSLGDQYMPENSLGRYNSYGRYPGTYQQGSGNRGSGYSDQLYPGSQGQRGYPQQGYLDFGYPSSQYEFGEFDPSYAETETYPGSHDFPAYRPGSKLDGPLKGQHAASKDDKLSHQGDALTGDLQKSGSMPSGVKDKVIQPTEGKNLTADSSMDTDSRPLSADTDTSEVKAEEGSQEPSSKEDTHKTDTADNSKSADDSSSAEKPDSSAKDNTGTGDSSKSSHAETAQDSNSDSSDLVKSQNAFISRERVNLKTEESSMQGPIIALSLGLAFTVILLVFVACRLRTVRRRLRKGRPLHSNEADYLINGMYL